MATDRFRTPQRPLPPSLSRRHEAATAAARANGVASGELDCQLAALRQRLATLEDQIAAEAVAALGAALEAELAAIRTAADELNHALARALGLRSFLYSHGGNYAFAQLAEKISQLRTPGIGATRQEVETAGAEWQRRFADLAG
jgi:BMFP domain-containing protein YqiC